MVRYGDWRSYYANLSTRSQFTAPVRYILNKPDMYRRQYIHQSEVDLTSMNRLLWEEHVNWTRMTIISIVFKLPDLPFVQERLLQNATDMGNCLRPFYGDAIADQYADLIKEHLVIAAELVTAAVQGDTKTAGAKEKEWYRNADQIADFLSRINPYIDREVMRQMMYSHLTMTKNEAVWMIQKKFKEDVAIFDKIEAEALMMADYISNAMVAQFPYLFQ
ncbi:hypothetical protein [Sporosarcina sp. HYO08]|uniref:hypothetical protein n=1 Tax=Sporosarcina sp. HYO08 TaxID=1759557 RepID=UPI000794234A|nr:hypothetical protein [Sporosarcina sp. HYO08]KXH86703.1 hypothetical protein AU377_14560 [Sporosarcina sp. HYO08]